MYRFPQTMSLMASELRNKVKVLSDDMSKVSGYFNELLDEFGESKDEYTADTFFEVLVKFYDAFMSELATLEKKKAKYQNLKLLVRTNLINYKKQCCLLTKLL